MRTSRDEWRNDGLSTDHYRDEAFALLQALWQMKDWLRNDPNVPSEAAANVERWVETEADHLKVASDVANGSKHMTLYRTRAEGCRPTKNSVHVFVGRGVQHTFFVTDERRGTDNEVVALADLCMAEWARFLDAHQIPLPPST